MEFKLHNERKSYEMLPVDIWTVTEVLKPSHMDALGYKLKMIDLPKSAKELVKLLYSYKNYIEIPSITSKL